MAISEPGHFPSRWYADQNGAVHLNNGNLYTDEGGNGILSNGTTFQFPGASIVALGTMNNNVVANGLTQANGTPLTAVTSILQTVASGNNAVVLPTPTALTQSVEIFNNGAANACVYPPLLGTLNGGAANAGVNLANGKGAVYIASSLSPPAWFSFSN